MWGFGAAALFWAIVQPWWSFPWADLSGSGYPLGEDGSAVASGALCLHGRPRHRRPVLALVVSLQHLRATQASVVGMTEPVLASFIAWAALGEVLSPVQIVGAVTVLVGVYLAERYRE